MRGALHSEGGWKKVLAGGGDESDRPLLEELLADPEIGISAAFALIQIDRRHAATATHSAP